MESSNAKADFAVLSGVLPARSEDFCNSSAFKQGCRAGLRGPTGLAGAKPTISSGVRLPEDGVNPSFALRLARNSEHSYPSLHAALVGWICIDLCVATRARFPLRNPCPECSLFVASIDAPALAWLARIRRKAYMSQALPAGPCRPHGSYALPGAGGRARNRRLARWPHQGAHNSGGSGLSALRLFPFPTAPLHQYAPAGWGVRLPHLWAVKTQILRRRISERRQP